MSDYESLILEKYNDIDDVSMAWGSTDLLPNMEDIPKEFTAHSNTKWNALFSDLFFGSVSDLEIDVKEGIDADAAWKCVQAHMRSYEPKHQHKEAGVAYMMSILFNDATWEKS